MSDVRHQEPRPMNDPIAITEVSTAEELEQGRCRSELPREGQSLLQVRSRRLRTPRRLCRLPAEQHRADIGPARHLLEICTNVDFMEQTLRPDRKGRTSESGCARAGRPDAAGGRARRRRPARRR